MLSSTSRFAVRDGPVRSRCDPCRRGGRASHRALGRERRDLGAETFLQACSIPEVQRGKVTSDFFAIEEIREQVLGPSVQE